jgi:hypothetical protein
VSEIPQTLHPQEAFGDDFRRQAIQPFEDQSSSVLFPVKNDSRARHATSWIIRKFAKSVKFAFGGRL